MYICIDSRECFAKGPKKSCLALSVTYEHDGECPFCKPTKTITDGKIYPWVNYMDRNIKKPR